MFTSVFSLLKVQSKIVKALVGTFNKETILCISMSMNVTID